MDIKASTPYTDMSKAARKLAEAHDGVRAAIEAHATAHAAERVASHAMLEADNRLKATSA